MENFIDFNKGLYKLFDFENKILKEYDYYKSSPYTANLISISSETIEIPEYVEYKNKRYYVSNIDISYIHIIHALKLYQLKFIIDKNNKFMFSENNCIYSISTKDKKLGDDYFLSWCYNKTVKSLKINPKCYLINYEAFMCRFDNIEELVFDRECKIYNITWQQDLPNLKQIKYLNKTIKKINNKWKVI